MVLIKRYLIPILLMTFLVAGCNNEPYAPRDFGNGTSIDGLNPNSLARRAFFTGRDSFGVAFQSHVSNAELLPEDTVDGVVNAAVSGRGNATHLGRITVDQTLKYDTGRDSVWGNFVFHSGDRNFVAGRFGGTATTSNNGQLQLAGMFWVSSHSIQAVHTESDTGWGSFTGTADFSKQALSYRMDGWLLHFVRDDAVE